jgi:hypothetical protein
MTSKRKSDQQAPAIPKKQKIAPTNDSEEDVSSFSSSSSSSALLLSEVIARMPTLPTIQKDLTKPFPIAGRVLSARLMPSEDKKFIRLGGSQVTLLNKIISDLDINYESGESIVCKAAREEVPIISKSNGKVEKLTFESVVPSGIVAAVIRPYRYDSFIVEGREIKSGWSFRLVSIRVLPDVIDDEFAIKNTSTELLESLNF